MFEDWSTTCWEVRNRGAYLLRVLLRSFFCSRQSKVQTMDITMVGSPMDFTTTQVKANLETCR